MISTVKRYVFFRKHFFYRSPSSRKSTISINEVSCLEPTRRWYSTVNINTLSLLASLYLPFSLRSPRYRSNLVNLYFDYGRILIVHDNSFDSQNYLFFNSTYFATRLYWLLILSWILKDSRTDILFDTCSILLSPLSVTLLFTFRY